MTVVRWRDTRSERDVWLIAGTTEADWPVSRPWDSKRFALLIATSHPIDAHDLAPGMLAQGLAAVACWGPNCDEVDTQFDLAIVSGGSDHETPDNVIMTTSHPDEPVEEALVFFLESLLPADAHAPLCNAWVIFAVGDIAGGIKHALDQRTSLRER